MQHAEHHEPITFLAVKYEVNAERCGQLEGADAFQSWVAKSPFHSDAGLLPDQIHCSTERIQIAFSDALARFAEIPRVLQREILPGVLADLASLPRHLRASAFGFCRLSTDAVEERFVHGMTR